jgi:uncharacterized RDD family membrane protein YckC
MTTTKNDKRVPGLGHRLMAMLYDGLLLFSVWFIASIPVIILATQAEWQNLPGFRLFLQLYLLLVAFLFFAWFWTHGGQTLGMRAWKLRLVTSENQAPDWRQCLVRYVTSMISWACLGLGFLWVLFDKDKLAWHDRLSGTRLVRTNAK